MSHRSDCGARYLARTLYAATGELDNRGSKFYLSIYWAQELAAKTDDAALGAHFVPLAESLTEQDATIVAELLAVQGKPVDIGGYCKLDEAKVTAAMRPSATFNKAIETLA